MKQLLSLLIITLITTTLSAQRFNAQNGFVVKGSTDTVYGQIKDRSNIRKSVLFKANDAAEFSTFTPADISAFFYEGGYYYRAVSVPVSDNTTERQFLLCLAEGYMNLYYTGKFYYVVKPGNPVAKLEKTDHLEEDRKLVDIRYKKVLAYLMSDCPQLSRDIERTGYNSSSLAGMIHAYNQCKSPDHTTPLHQKRFKVKVRPGIRIGTLSGNYAYIVPDVRLYAYTFTPDRRYSGGLTFNFPINNKWSIQPELLLTSKSAYGIREVATFRYEAKIDLMFLQMPLMVYYHLPTKKIRPFVNAGMVYGYILKKDAAHTSGRSGNLDINSDELGLIRGGGGVAFHINRKMDVSLEYTYERSIINRTYVSEKIRSVSHYFWLGVQADLFP